MFELLDLALKDLLHDASLNADFVTPAKPYPQTQGTVNLFLYETRENRELRDPAPITDPPRNGLSVRRRPPLRVDCAYMVTAWSELTGPDKVAAEHKLLAQVFRWLSRFPIIPDRNLQTAGMTGQTFPPPTLVAQMDAAKNVGEFWSALGIAPRPFFNLIVTITMDLDQAIEDSIVTTISSRYLNLTAGPASAEELIIIGGTVRDKASKPVADAWVRLEPTGWTQRTDIDGRFVFGDLLRGANYQLQARAPGHNEVTSPIFEIPSLTGEYDLKFIT